MTRSDEQNFTSEVDDDVRDGTCLFLPRKRILQGGSRDVPVLVPVRASPVPSVVRNRNNTPGLELGIDRPAPSPSACLAPLTGTARSTPLLLVRRR